MGKYPQSTIHNDYSKWHYEKLARTSYVTDLDVTYISRLWAELRNRRIAGVYDLKFLNGIDGPTPAEEIAAKDLESCGIPCWELYIDFGSPIERLPFRAKLRRFGRDGFRILTEEELIDYLNGL